MITNNYKLYTTLSSPLKERIKLEQDVIDYEEKLDLEFESLTTIEDFLSKKEQLLFDNNSSINLYKKELTNLNTLKDGKCHVCGSIYDEEGRKNRVATLTEELEALTSKKIEITEDVSLLRLEQKEKLLTYESFKEKFLGLISPIIGKLIFSGTPSSGLHSAC